MSNEMKLLYALCEALGFEVETTLDYQPMKESQCGARRYLQGYPGLDRALSYNVNGLEVDEDGKYTSLLIDPIIDYKLHKRNEQP